jgi:threonine dehydratase
MPAFTPAEVVREVALADERIRPYIRHTPLERSHALSRASGADVYLKLEALQVTGSFKARGALNKLLALSPAERAAGVVTASTGNHALAMAHALGTLGIEGEIFLPASVSPAKLDALESRGARLRLLAEDPGLVEVLARRAAEDSGRVYVSPYNDPQVIGGQGTVALEIRRELGSPDAVFVPVGGGGLVAGMAADLAAHAPGTEVVGCQPDASPVLVESIKAGRLLELPSAPSLSDATLGLLEPDSITFPLCRDLVARWVVVEEAAIRAAVRLVLEKHSLLIEGAAALPVAALLTGGNRWRGARAVLVLSGSHIALSALATVLDPSVPAVR